MFSEYNDTTTSQYHSQDTRMELYSIVLSATMLFLAILFGGGGCATVLIAMCVHRLLRKLRYMLMAVLLLVCCLFDFIWCPLEISRLVLHHQNSNNNIISENVIMDLKHVGGSLYMLLICGLGAIIILICVQNILKLLHKYDAIPKVKFGIIVILLWLILTTSLTIVFVIMCLYQEDDGIYHSINQASFRFKIGVETMWLLLLLTPIILMLVLHLHTKYWNEDLSQEISDLHSTENFTVPSLIIKSVEEIAEEDEDENSVALPSPDIQRDSIGGSPESKSSKSALKKRCGSPSSQKVLFADDPSPTQERGSSNFGEKVKSQNHLGVNMSAILGRRRHTIAQITDPQLDLIQKAKSYNYVRKFSVDISALQAQLENPKLHGSFPFHSQQDIKKDNSENKLQPLNFSIPTKKRSREEIIKSQEIIEEHENEHANDNDLKKQDIENNSQPCKPNEHKEAVKDSKTSENHEKTGDNANHSNNNTDVTDRTDSITNRKDSITNRKDSIIDWKDSITERKDSITNRNDSITYRRESIPTNRKDSIPESVHSRNTSVRSGRSARDSICPTPPLISLTQSDGEEKQLELNTSDTNLENTYNVCKKKSTYKPCKLSILLVLTFILSILPMYFTEILRDVWQKHSGYINVIAVTTSISMVQTMIYPQVIFCVDNKINKAVHRSFIKTRQWMTSVVSRVQEVPTREEISDTEV